MNDKINEPRDAILPIAGSPLSKVETTVLLGLPVLNCSSIAFTTS